MENQTREKKLSFGGAELPRLRVLSFILFSVRCVLVFVLAAPAPVRMDPENPADIAFVFIRLSMLLCGAAGVGCGAVLLIFAPLPVTLALIPVTGGLSYFLTRDVWTAVGAMCFFAAPFLLCRLLGIGMPRTGAVVRLSACLGAVFLPFYYRSVAVAMGTAAPKEILAKISDGCQAAFSSATVEYMGKTYTYTAQDAALMTELLLVLLPALILHGMDLPLFRCAALPHPWHGADDSSPGPSIGVEPRGSGGLPCRLPWIGDLLGQHRDRPPRGAVPQSLSPS